ncbi:MAG TPA: malto-oligosyltrehalose synthase [Acidimicrobiales bacterium]|nr:malto-oligosyltrehalose synthase [Acidimicrobiales bacterium]
MTIDATYRVQLHAQFPFHAAAALADYLAALGITHLYCSPYFQAAAGSTHGYDVVDPQRFNTELGGAPGHAHMVGELRRAGLGQVLDIVPNHMGADPANRWWWDVLENGHASRYARFFDIDWDGPDDRSAFTVLAPVLGDHYGRVLEAGELRLARVGGAFVLQYHDHRLPVSPKTVDQLLSGAARRAGSSDLAALAEAFGGLPDSRITDHAAVMERHSTKLSLESALARLCDTHELIGAAIDAEMDSLAHDPDRFDLMLQRQNYRLAYWRAASEELDYRRFFNIETLVGVRVEDPEVFRETHSLVLDLVRDGTVDGLRVDHVDGLREPESYLRALSDETGGVYTIVEKILAPNEDLPQTWPVAGTSGYDFVTRVNALFVVSANEEKMSECYTAFSGETDSFAEVVYAAKQQIMLEELAAEVERLTGLLAQVTDRHRRHRDHTRRDLRGAIREIVAHFPVYRTYLHAGSGASAADRLHVASAVSGAIDRRRDIDRELLTFIGELAVGEHRGEREIEFAERLQQLTAPVVAKGVEDTAFYRYHRLISLNEVGGDPGVFGQPIAHFHERTAASAKNFPQSMLTLSTHDTKRSADVRARLNVLSEMPVAWRDATQRWANLNDRHRVGEWPDRNAEYLLYQTLIGAWPLDADRLVAFMSKATKEAKVHTSWLDPVSAYDDALERFVRTIISDDEFVDEVQRFASMHRIIERGYRNSIAQTALLMTCPGVPDLYQGSEIWDFSLVDPDNRRSVDYGVRRQLLADIQSAPPDEVFGCLDVGRPKLWLIHRALEHRRQHAALYQSDAYEPLAVEGSRSEDVVAFARGGLAVVAPCRSAEGWRNTSVGLPAGAWFDLISNERVDGGQRAFDDLLARFPAAILVRESR